MARDFYAPVLVTAVPVGDRIVLRGINDSAGARQVQVTAQAITPDGSQRDLWAGGQTFGAEAVDLHCIASADLAADEILAFHWQDDSGASGRDIHAPRPFKSYELVAPELTMQVDGLSVTLTTQNLALFVAVEADVAGRWSGNVLHLLPGETRTLTFTPADPTSTRRLTLRNLHSATYA
jgi:beta-mannosidase